MLHREMSSLTAMMEKLLEQNSEKLTQKDAAPTTSSFTVQLSNMVTGVNRTQRNYYQDYEYVVYYEDSSRNSAETTLLNPIQDLPSRLQKSNNKLFQTHVSNLRGAKDKDNEFKHLLLNHFQLLANKITEVDKIHFFQSLYATRP